MQLADLTTIYRGRLISDTYKQWLTPGSDVLDVGCGNGVIAHILQKNFKLNLMGTDIESYLTRNIRFVRMTHDQKLPFKRRQFDIVMFNDALHHTEYETQKILLREALRVGKIIILFELNPTIVTRFFDWTINMLHYRQMHIPFTYRTSREWQELFYRLKVKANKIEVSTPWWYPFSHQAYRLTRT